MPYPFDQTLIPSVLADRFFQASGVHLDRDTGLFFAVIDPRRHNVDVWSKRRPPSVLARASMAFFRNPYTDYGAYTGTAVGLGARFFTNGPIVQPPPMTGWRWYDKWKAVEYLALGQPWLPNGRIITGGRLVEDGGARIAYFGRTGSGSFSSYHIAADPVGPPRCIEAIGGLYPICQNGGIVSGGYQSNDLQIAIGIAAWGLCPTPRTLTEDWSTEVPYLENADRAVLDGVIIAAGSDTPEWNQRLATQMLAVGVTDAVVTDASDSVLVGSGTSVHVACVTLKDIAQQYGLCCR